MFALKHNTILKSADQRQYPQSKGPKSVRMYHHGPTIHLQCVRSSRPQAVVYTESIRQNKWDSWRTNIIKEFQTIPFIIIWNCTFCFTDPRCWAHSYMLRREAMLPLKRYSSENNAQKCEVTAIMIRYVYLLFTALLATWESKEASVFIFPVDWDTIP